MMMIVHLAIINAITVITHSLWAPTNLPAIPVKKERKMKKKAMMYSATTERAISKEEEEEERNQGNEN